jgi:hypothetical protein
MIAQEQAEAAQQKAAQEAAAQRAAQEAADIAQKAELFHEPFCENFNPYFLLIKS